MTKTENVVFTLSSDKTNFRTPIYPPLKLNRDARHELALLSLDMYHSIPNVTEDNNTFSYRYKEEYHDIHLPTGSYGVEAINGYIQRQLKLRKHLINDDETIFEIRSNVSTLKCEIEIRDPNMAICFGLVDSIEKLLGFTVDKLEGVGTHEGQKIIDIMTVNSIFVQCGIIEGSYLNGSQRPILYSFFPDVAPGYKLVEEPKTVVYFPVSVPVVSDVHVWLTDQRGNPLNLRGELVTMRLHLRSTTN